MQALRGIQSAFNPQSPDALAVAKLMWALFAGGGVIFVVVMALVAIAIWHRPAWLAAHRAILIGGVAFPLVVVASLLFYSLAVLAEEDGRQPVLRIEVVGHQWWWQVRYLDRDGGIEFETANEIRLPVGEPVELALRSGDVLHSFWVPVLGGKLDLVPGRTNRMRIRSNATGVFRGQCAEYCGGPHAQMALFVVAEDAAAFERWRAHQRQPAAAENALFVEHCATCHTVRGTGASGTLGPDLTHVGSRLSIAAGILPNNTGTLAAWISSSQHIKPGNLMPSFERFSGSELGALATYLQELD